MIKRASTGGEGRSALIPRADLYRDLICDRAEVDDDTLNAAVAALLAKEWPLAMEVLGDAAQYCADRLHGAFHGDRTVRVVPIHLVPARGGTRVAHSGHNVPSYIRLHPDCLRLEAIDGLVMLIVNDSDQVVTGEVYCEWWRRRL